MSDTAVMDEAEALLEEFTVPEGTYEIDLPNGKKIEVKNVCSVEQMTAIQRKSADLLKISNSGSAPKEWRAYLPFTSQTASIVAEFALLVVKPKFSDIQVLKMCKQAGPLAAYVHTEIVKSMARTVAEGESEALEDEKNASAPMEQAGSTSPSAETSSTSTPNTSARTNGDTPAASSL